ncbi:TylF/MycF/NovP-related O-methyltransferase [Ammoniphilus sp. YIM 78166]|uniref:TylF/MycF/NovP-related O-methyltransferase n=1 Tax=Ammoniphilus sp. YIM 78166 TaxID=1644106 RepID=UPI00196B26A0|nr:TylF/MycF/NovP-related O-methyltransferase [Ammoniphilus sp. YIM 78166]
MDIIQHVRKANLTYLSHSALSELREAVREIEREGRKGVIIEAGCALGGSALVIAASKSFDRPFYVYDVFGMIPSPSSKDGTDVHERYKSIISGKSKGIGSRPYYGYMDQLDDFVKNNFKSFGFPIDKNNIHLIKGLFQDTLILNDPVVLAHLDCDWYDSVSVCLERIVPLLVKGGKLIIDDYYTWSGCYKAVNEFFSDKKENYKFIDGKTRLHIQRVK